MMADERREFLRVPLQVVVRLSDGERLLFHSDTVDLSMRGARIRETAELVLGQEVELSLLLGEAPSQVHVEILGRVARVDDQGLGIEFTGVRGVESLDHLRRLVLYNAADTARVEEEFRNHRGLKRRD
jgi:hypothetical protein